MLQVHSLKDSGIIYSSDGGASDGGANCVSFYTFNYLLYWVYLFERHNNVCDKHLR